MWAALKKLWNDCTTENDGTSYDFVRVLAVLMGSSGWSTFLGLAIYSVVKSPDHHFEMMNFGTAMGAIMVGVAGVAIGVAQKQKTDTQ
jgi:membrane protein DedA with SNARE-associated domain